MSIGSKIKSLRESAGLSQAELGKIAGVTDKAVSTWENDLKTPRMGAIRVLADYFRVPTSYNVDDAEEVNRKLFSMKMLRELRRAKGLTMKEFGATFGLAESTVSQYETGKRQPDLDMLLRFADFFDISVDYLPRGKPAADSFGDKLKEIRISRNLTQDQLAELLGTTKQVVSRYEKGQRTPKNTIAQEYARKLGVTLPFLLGDQPLESHSTPSYIMGWTDEAAVVCEAALSPDELLLLRAYRAADPGMRSAVAKLLDLPQK